MVRFHKCYKCYELTRVCNSWTNINKGRGVSGDTRRLVKVKRKHLKKEKIFFFFPCYSFLLFCVISLKLFNVEKPERLVRAVSRVYTALKRSSVQISKVNDCIKIYCKMNKVQNNHDFGTQMYTSFKFWCISNFWEVSHQKKISSTVSSEGHYRYSTMSHWEPEGLYHCTQSMALAPFWFSTEHQKAFMPFWLSAGDMQLHSY